MSFNVSACDIRVMPRPRNNDQNKTGNISRKKHHQRLRTDEGDVQDNTVLTRGKKVRTNNSQSEASSSSVNKACSVPRAMASNPNEDALLGDKKVHQTDGESNFPNHNRFMTLKLTYDSHDRSRHGLPLKFMRANGLDKPGEIGLLAKDGRKFMVRLLRDSRGRMSLGKGWKDFVLANGLQVDESFTLELIWNDSTPMFRLSTTSTDSEGDEMQGKYCSQPCEEDSPCEEESPCVEESVSSEPSSGNRDKNDKDSIEDREYSSSETNNRVLTLTLKPIDVIECKLILPSEFMRAYCIDKPGKVTILGKGNMKWWGRRSSGAGNIDIGIGWENFCKANGVQIGNLFTLEFICEEEDTTPVFRICPKSGD